jgi:Mor family transcriptional regulator
MNGELFDPMSAGIDEILRRDDADTETAMDDHIWPKTLAEMIDVLADDHIDHGMDAADAMAAAQHTVAKLAHHFGARMVYLPKDKGLRLALRNNIIWRKFVQSRSMRSINELAIEYDMSDQQMYNIIRAQKKLTVRRKQGDLFTNSE